MTRFDRTIVERARAAARQKQVFESSNLSAGTNTVFTVFRSRLRTILRELPASPLLDASTLNLPDRRFRMTANPRQFIPAGTNKCQIDQRSIGTSVPGALNVLGLLRISSAWSRNVFEPMDGCFSSCATLYDARNRSTFSLPTLGVAI